MILRSRVLRSGSDHRYEVVLLSDIISRQQLLQQQEKQPAARQQPPLSLLLGAAAVDVSVCVVVDVLCVLVQSGTVRLVTPTDDRRPTTDDYLVVRRD